VVAIVAAVDVVALAAMGVGEHGNPVAAILLGTFLTLAVIGCATLFRIAFARQAFNDSVMSYNNRREVFPSNILAGMYNFAPAALLEIEDPAKREAPKVSF